MIVVNYIQIDNFVVKCRAYPSKEQQLKIDRILQGIRIAHNVTCYEMVHENESITKPSKKDESVRFPNFSECMKKSWLDYLRANYDLVNEVPASSLSSSVYGVFSDAKKGWEKKKLPCDKWRPEYYTTKKPRTSFTVQTLQSGFEFPEDSKSVFVNITNIGKIKIRGWRNDLRYGEKPDSTFEEFYRNTKKAFGVTVSRDNCGDYWMVIRLQTVWKPCMTQEEAKPLGVDVGIKDLAITSAGDKYPNMQFKRKEKRHIRKLSRKISRRYGWSNIEFRKEHKQHAEIVPSKGYESALLKKARLERKIARRRNNYNHETAMDIVRQSSFIGIEDLLVKGMMKNKHLAYSVTDVAMGDLLQKLKYKSEWNHVPIVQIGRFEPSSQLCSTCGYKNKKVKNLSIREWTCPECGTRHDRDVNAAKNILSIAQAKAAN